MKRNNSRLDGNPEKKEQKRKQSLDGFRDGRYEVMIATDIAARGIDVTQISHVINYDMPATADAYTHRIGRTGRAMKTGDAFTFITGQDCDIANTKNMIAGLQAMSVFKDMRLLAEQTVTMVLDILAGKTPETNAVYANRVFDVPSFNCTPVFADANNYKELLLDSGFYTEADLAN